MSILFHIFQMLRLFSRSPAPQLIEKCLLAYCDGNVTGFLVFPTKPAIFRLAWSSSRPKFDAFVARLPLPHRGFQSHSVRLHPASATFHKAQTQAAERMYVKEDKRRRDKRLGTWILFSLTAPGSSFWSTWIYTIRLNVSCDVGWWSNHLMYLYPDAICCSRSHLWAETCRNEEGSGERLLCDGRHALVLAAPSRFCTYESSPPTRWDVSGREAYKLLNSAVALEVITLCKQGQPLPVWKQYWRG